MDIVKAIKRIEVMDSKFKKSFVHKIVDGANTFFWHEPWCDDGSILKDKFPMLYALEVDEECKVKDRGQVVNVAWVGN